MSTHEQSSLTCKEVVELFGDYADNELGETVTARIEDHLAICPECQEFERSYRFVIETAALLKPASISMPLEAKNRLRAVLNMRLGLSLPPAG